MVTSDERREVAARLRDQPRFDLDTPFDEAIGRLCDAVSGDTDGDLDPGMFALQEDLADLIEPEPERTCHIMPDKTASEQCFGPMLSCDACGAWIPPINGQYRFCPVCGARVVSNDN